MMNVLIQGDCPLKSILLSCQSCTLQDSVERSKCAAETALKYTSTLLELANGFYTDQVKRAYPNLDLEKK